MIELRVIEYKYFLEEFNHLLIYNNGKENKEGRYLRKVRN